MSHRPGPEPSANPSERALPLRSLHGGYELYRIHRGAHDPIFFGSPSPTPDSRFDDPAGEYKVCYLGEQREAAFVERCYGPPHAS